MLCSVGSGKQTASHGSVDPRSSLGRKFRLIPASGSTTPLRLRGGEVIPSYEWEKERRTAVPFSLSIFLNNPFLFPESARKLIRALGSFVVFARFSSLNARRFSPGIVTRELYCRAWNLYLFGYVAGFWRISYPSAAISRTLGNSGGFAPISRLDE